MGYRIMFLVSQLTAELWNACMSITFSGMGYEMVNQIIVVKKGHHANIVQMVKMCYKIKINSRESKSCFYVSVSAMQPFFNHYACYLCSNIIKTSKLC